MNAHTLRRWLRRRPTHNEMLRDDPAYRAAWHEWKRGCHECARRIHGPRRECDSIGDMRWPFNEHDEQALLALKRQKDDFRRRGYTWVRPPYEQSDQSWLADWRKWNERARARDALWG